MKKFKYKLPFYWNFCYRHVIDDHNNLNHALIKIGDTWVTYKCECQVFAFILVISEGDTFFILGYFVYYELCQDVMPTLLGFCLKLAWQLINKICI